MCVSKNGGGGALSATIRPRAEGVGALLVEVHARVTAAEFRFGNVGSRSMAKPVAPCTRLTNPWSEFSEFPGRHFTVPVDTIWVVHDRFMEIL